MLPPKFIDKLKKYLKANDLSLLKILYSIVSKNKISLFNILLLEEEGGEVSEKGSEDLSAKFIV